MQAQIRLKDQSDQGSHCLQFLMLLLDVALLQFSNKLLFKR